MSKSTAAATGEAANSAALARWHLGLGWLALAVFGTLGLGLEALHGLKVQWYLSVANDTRHLLLRLAHVHGTLLGLVHVALALTVGALPSWPAASRRLASRCLLAALVLLPGGFVLGGIWAEEGDPGIGIVLTPVGGLLLVAGLALVARAAATSD